MWFFVFSLNQVWAELHRWRCFFINKIRRSLVEFWSWIFWNQRILKCHLSFTSSVDFSKLNKSFNVNRPFTICYRIKMFQITNRSWGAFFLIQREIWTLSIMEICNFIKEKNQINKKTNTNKNNIKTRTTTNKQIQKAKNKQNSFMYTRCLGFDQEHHSWSTCFAEMRLLIYYSPDQF